MNEFFCPLVFLCDQCPTTLDGQYLTFQALLEHHVQAHEYFFPQARALGRALAGAGTIGRRNTRTWRSALGDVHAAQEAG